MSSISWVQLYCKLDELAKLRKFDELDKLYCKLVSWLNCMFDELANTVSSMSWLT